MTSDEPFLRAILAAPADAAPRLVYADWLDERGDPRATAFRELPDLGRLLAALTTDAQATLDELECHALAGRVSLLAALDDTLALPAIERLVTNPTWPNVAAGVRDRVRRVLALSARSDALERLLERPDRWGAHSPRELASQVAGRSPPEVYEALFARHPEKDAVTEFLACLAQELVVRGEPLAASEPATRFWERLDVARHPLAALPLSRTDLETGLAAYLPRYSGSGSSQSMPYRSEGPATPIVAVASVPLPDVQEASDPLVVTQMSSVVAEWTTTSNGLVEARVFGLSRLVPDSEVSGDLLEALGLEALAGLSGYTISRQAEVVPADRALDVLFGASSGGGAYTRGRLGAYGRLDAWASIAGLVGASHGEPVNRLAELARASLWASVTPAQGWAYDVAWDFGLVAVRPDRRSLAVLFATDTD
jgi:uncharacterized protein (TIGR02996 family)